MGKLKNLTLMLIGAAGGAAAMYYADPDRGRARRSQATDQIGAAVRDGLETAEQQIDYRAGQAKGAVAERVDVGEREYDDRTLEHKVESEVLGHVDVDSGEVVVIAEDGHVTLRGPVPTQSRIDEILRRTRDLRGVRSVTNQLHLPGEPAEPSEEPIEASHQAG